MPYFYFQLNCSGAKIGVTVIHYIVFFPSQTVGVLINPQKHSSMLDFQRDEPWARLSKYSVIEVTKTKRISENKVL